MMDWGKWGREYTLTLFIASITKLCGRESLSLSLSRVALFSFLFLGEHRSLETIVIGIGNFELITWSGNRKSDNCNIVLLQMTDKGKGKVTQQNELKPFPLERKYELPGKYGR